GSEVVEDRHGCADWEMAQAQPSQRATTGYRERLTCSTARTPYRDSARRGHRCRIRPHATWSRPASTTGSLSRGVVSTTGVTEDDGREVLGVMSATAGPKAIRNVVRRSPYRRCRVRLLRDVSHVIGSRAAETVAATTPTVFARPAPQFSRT